MKFRLLIFISLFATNSIKNANSVGERGKESKLYKTFDEIFGKGWDDEINDSKDLNCRHVKQDVQAPNTSDQKNIDEIYDENWFEDENNSAPSADDFDQDNSKKHFPDQNNSNDQNESVDEQQNVSNEYKKIEFNHQKREIIQKFREMKEDYTKNRKYSANEHVQIERKISNGLGVARTKLYKWMKELGLTQEKFSELEKCKILKQFDEIKSKCKQAKLKNISMRELDDKIAKKLGVNRSTITEWKRKFGLSASKKKFSDATKIEILKKYAKIKEKNPKMSDLDIADLLKISKSSLNRWKIKFCEENKHL